jgi:hypothetical protein
MRYMMSLKEWIPANKSTYLDHLSIIYLRAVYESVIGETVSSLS